MLAKRFRVGRFGARYHVWETACGLHGVQSLGWSAVWLAAKRNDKGKKGCHRAGNREHRPGPEFPTLPDNELVTR